MEYRKQAENASVMYLLLKFLKKKVATVINSHFMNQSPFYSVLVTEGPVQKGYYLTKVTGKSVKWINATNCENYLKIII